MLRLQCVESVQAVEKNTRSRIAVLDIEHPIYDFALAAGHAVPTERPCKVKDFRGNSSDVDLIRLADNYAPGAQTDWAIIRFPKIKTQNLVRYRLEPLADNENLKGVEVKFAQAIGLPKNTQICQLNTLEFSTKHKRVTHNCSVIAGQSGSPVTRTVDGEDRLVGLNLGQLWMFQSPETGRPDRKGYINLLDADTLLEIETYIDEAR